VTGREQGGRGGRRAGQRAATLRVAPAEACPACQRPREECLCDRVERLSPRVTVAILQHPREQYKLAGSARLAHLALGGSVLRVGFSWPNLAAAVDPGSAGAQPAEWAVLYLKGKPTAGRPFQLFDRRDRPVAAPPRLRGLVALDGNWQQAKTLWWRNPWLLKLHRVALDPGHPSLRPQVRAAGLSTIEAIAFALACLGEDTALVESLRRQYAELVVAPWLARAAGDRAPRSGDGPA
jgi:DTW domain-containing protein YfiP